MVPMVCGLTPGAYGVQRSTPLSPPSNPSPVSLGTTHLMRPANNVHHGAAAEAEGVPFAPSSKPEQAQRHLRLRGARSLLRRESVPGSIEDLAQHGDRFRVVSASHRDLHRRYLLHLQPPRGEASFRSRCDPCLSATRHSRPFLLTGLPWGRESALRNADYPPVRKTHGRPARRRWQVAHGRRRYPSNVDNRRLGQSVRVYIILMATSSMTGAG